MKVYLPIHTTAINPPTMQELTTHQTALFTALRVMSTEKQDFIDRFLKESGVPAKLAKNAVAHAKKVSLILDLDEDWFECAASITEWFGASVYRDKTEYVQLHGRWYERTWKKFNIVEPTAKQGVIFIKDWTAKHPTAGLTILTDKKNLRTLTYGMAVEKQSKQIRNAAQKHLKNVQEADYESYARRQKLYDVIEDQYVRDRGLKINEAVKEILKESHTLLFVGPVTLNDKRYFRSNGIFEIIKRLQFAVYQTRKAKKPLELVVCDPRLVRTTYDENDLGHTAMAKGLAGILDAYVKLSKTVK